MLRLSCVVPLQHAATHCNTLQHTATHCNTLQHTVTHCNTHAHVAPLMCCATVTHCNMLQHTSTHCNILQHTATHMHILRLSHVVPLQPTTATCCNTLQDTATDCNTLARVEGGQIMLDLILESRRLNSQKSVTSSMTLDRKSVV